MRRNVETRNERRLGLAGQDNLVRAGFAEHTLHAIALCAPPGPGSGARARASSSPERAKAVSPRARKRARPLRAATEEVGPRGMSRRTRCRPHPPELVSAKVPPSLTTLGKELARFVFAELWCLPNSAQIWR